MKKKYILKYNLLFIKLLFLFLLANLVTSTSYGQLQCRNLFSQKSTNYLVAGNFLPTFKEWVNKTLVSEKENSIKYTESQKQMTRWELLKSGMSPLMRDLLMKSRPEFFQDQIPPNPIELTEGLIKTYKANSIPEKDWILPGLALKNKETHQVIYKTYIDLNKEGWPKGYKLAGEFLSSYDYVKGLSEGVVHIVWASDIHPKFKVMAFYHDLGHISAFGNPEYFYALKKFYAFSKKKIEESTDKDEADFGLFGTYGGEVLIEDFWYFPKDKHAEVNSVLSKAKLKNGEALSADTQLEYYETLKVIPDDLALRWMNLYQRSKQLSDVKMKDYNLHTPLESMPIEIQQEIASVQKEYSDLYIEIKPFVDGMQALFDNQKIELGGATLDYFSQRSQYYSLGHSEDFSIKMIHLKYALIDGIKNRHYTAPEFVNRQLSEMLMMIYTHAKNSPMVHSDNLIKRLSEKRW